MATEIAIPWAIQKKIQMIRAADDRAGVPFLKPSVVECVKQKLGPGTTHFPEGGDYDEFTLADGRDVSTVLMREEDLPDDFKAGAPGDPGEVGAVISNDAALATRVLEILEECASGKVDLADVRRGVAQREASKVYNTLFKGTPLTRDTAALVANMAATKKFEGGRRKTARKTKKTKKAKKTLKRRR